jgi:hypothetical protein
MAYAKITLTNGVESKTAPVGFSWTTCLFGFWPALFRGDWKMALIIFVCTLFTYGLAGIVFAFFYNKMYITGLVRKKFWFLNTIQLTDTELQNYLEFVKLPRGPADL